MLNFHEQAQHVDELIRQGKFSRARKILTNVKVSRTFDMASRVLLASLWKRLGEPFKAMKILGSMEKFGASRPSTLEKEKWLEFADCLLKVNALGAVSRILSSDALKSQNRYHLIKSFLFIHSWDYRSGLESLRQYLKTEADDSYSHFVGRINELACLTFLQMVEEALSSAEELLPRLKAKNFDRLLGNSIEILMQLVFQKLDPPQTQRLKKLIETFSKFQWEDVAVIDQLQLRKWKAYQSLKENKVEGLQNLRSIREIGISKGLSELVRDIDRMILESGEDKYGEAFLCFGTPYEAFLDHFNLNANHQAPAVYISWDAKNRHWSFVPEKKISSGKIRVFDVMDYCEQSEFSLTSKLFLAVFFDFYRSPSTVELFDRVYPADYFHPISSLRKINQLVHRLNREFKEKKIPFRLIEKDLLYILEGSENHVFKLSLPPSKVVKMNEVELRADKFRKMLFGEFTLSQALNVTKMKRRTLQALLKLFIDEGLMARTGSTSKVTYYWKI